MGLTDRVGMTVLVGATATGCGLVASVGSSRVNVAGAVVEVATGKTGAGDAEVVVLDAPATSDSPVTGEDGEPEAVVVVSCGGVAAGAVGGATPVVVVTGAVVAGGDASAVGVAVGAALLVWLGSESVASAPAAAGATEKVTLALVTVPSSVVMRTPTVCSPAVVGT